MNNGTRRRAVTIVAALVAALHDAGAQTRPNVVLIMTDDAGYGDLGVYGATDLRTPNLDRLARDGVRFTDFYANAPSCTPTRAGLITGRYQQRVRLEYPLGMQRPADYDRGLPATGRSLPQLMKNAGYATALVGKWHLGWKPEYSPIRHGFDYFFGFKSGFIDFYTHTSPDSPGYHDLFENDSAVHVDGYMTDLITERSVRWIERNARRPFFIDVAYNAPHWPYQVPDKPSVARDSGRHLSAFDDPTSSREDYVAMVERVDQGVGRILAALDRLGLRENTIVIYTNDNGGEWLSRNTPLFNHKMSTWEGGIRVPTIIRWPSRIAAGKVTRQVGITMDLTASMLAVAGAQLPADLRLDGIDLFPILEGRAPDVERTLFWRAHPARPNRAVRSGDWKLVLEPRPMLFNLRDDIGERENLIGRHPVIARRLFGQLQQWERDVASEVDAAPSAQNPSPMTESTRAHERLAQRELAGARFSFAGPGGHRVDVFVPERARARDSIDAVIHFHGAAWLPHQAVDALDDARVSTVLHLGAGSGVYHRAFSDAAVFDSLLTTLAREVSTATGRAVRLGRVTLSGFSAGHGAIRVILREPRHFERVAGVLLLDGMHASYVPEGQALAAGGMLDTTNLAAFASFARAAMRGEKRFLVTHSEIFPGTFASTTETADWLIRSLGLQRTAVVQWAPRGMQQLSEVRSGRFEVLGFAGNSAPDHVDQFHAMPELLARLMQQALPPPTR